MLEHIKKNSRVIGAKIKKRLLEYGRNISEKCRWTVLARIGNSPPMRLTIFVPFIGMLLIFNENTEIFFRLSSQFVSDLGLENGSLFSLNSLYFTYFGLCTLGVASSIYALRCPDVISDEPNQMQYINSIEHGATPVLAKANFQNVLNIYLDHNDEHDEVAPVKVVYPENLLSAFFNLMEGLHLAKSAERAPDSTHNQFNEEQEFETDEENYSHQDEYEMEFMTGTGYFDYHKMAEAVAMNRRIHWPFTLPFRDTAPKFAKDIAFVLHMTMDYQRFYSRILISLLYFLGFMLLLVPTIRTFFLLSINLTS